MLTYGVDFVIATPECGLSRGAMAPCPHLEQNIEVMFVSSLYLESSEAEVDSHNMNEKTEMGPKQHRNVN